MNKMSNFDQEWKSIWANFYQGKISKFVKKLKF